MTLGVINTLLTRWIRPGTITLRTRNGRGRCWKWLNWLVVTISAGFIIGLSYTLYYMPKWDKWLAPNAFMQAVGGWEESVISPPGNGLIGFGSLLTKKTRASLDEIRSFLSGESHGYTIQFVGGFSEFSNHVGHAFMYSISPALGVSGEISFGYCWQRPWDKACEA